MEQKLKANGTCNAIQKASEGAHPRHKTSGTSATHQDKKTVSHTHTDRKKTQGDTENQEASSRQLHPQINRFDSKSSETQSNKPEGTSESSREIKDEEMEVDENKHRGMENICESQSSGDLTMECTEKETERRSNKEKAGNLDSGETQTGNSLNNCELFKLYTAVKKIGKNK